jgi:hypothetical protein
VLTHNFKFTNNGEQTLIIDHLDVGCGCLSYSIDKMELQPGEDATLTLILDTTNLSGLTVRKVVIYANIENQQKEVTVMTEVK